LNHKSDRCGKIDQLKTAPFGAGNGSVLTPAHLYLFANRMAY